MYAPFPVLNGGLRRHSGSPPAGEDDGLGVFVSFAASMTCCVFFAVINDAGDYPILSAYRACRDARRRVETGVSPTPKGGCGGHPPHIRAYTRNRFFAYQPQVTRRREPSPIPSAYHCLSAASATTLHDHTVKLFEVVAHIKTIVHHCASCAAQLLS